MTYQRWIRIALGYLALVSLEVGAWALFAPRSFYDGFPGFGSAWISVDGPYNEHLVRDVGALNLALVVLLVAAAVTLSRPMIVTAALAALVWGVPHFLYHLFNTDGFSTGDVVLILGSLALSAGVPAAVLVVSGRISPDSSPRDTTPAPTGAGLR